MLEVLRKSHKSQGYIFIPKFVIYPPLFQKFQMCPTLCYLASVNNKYLVRVDNGRQPVGDGYGCPALLGRFKCLLYNLLALHIQGRSGFIQEQY